MGNLMAGDKSAVVTREGPGALIGALNVAGYRVCGPVVRDQAIVYGAIQDRMFTDGAHADRSPDCPSVHPSPAFFASVALQRAPVGPRTGT